MTTAAPSMSSPSPLVSGAVLTALLGVCFAVAGGGAWATTDGVLEWYPTLVRPWWRPPNALFGPVWTTLYTMMAVAMWNVWRQSGPDRWKPAAVAFAVQLALNAAWSPLFFAARRLDLALLDIVAMWCAIVGTIALFWSRSRLSALLLVPYLAWVSFATALNAWIWWMN